MSAHHSSRDDASRERYDRARNDFDAFDLEDKATFLVEALTATVARGVEEAGKALSDEFGELFRAARRRGASKAHSEGDAPGSGPGPAEPETSQRKAPR